MARLREFVPAVRALGLKKFIFILCHEISKDQLTTQAAAVAYAWLFAVFPFLLFLLTLFAYIPKEKVATAQQHVSMAINRVLAQDAADTIVTNLNEVLSQPRSGLLSIGLIVTLWIASGGMAMTMSALDAAYDNKKSYPFYIQRPIAMLLTIVVIILNLIVLLLLPVGTAIEKFLAESGQLPAHLLWAFTAVRYALAILFMLSILSLLYTFGTRVRHRLTFFSPGAIFTLLVWIVLGEAFRFYVEKFGRYQKTYGTVGGVAIILLFFYLDALMLLIGAEINNLVERTMREREME